MVNRSLRGLNPALSMGPSTRHPSKQQIVRFGDEDFFVEESDDLLEKFDKANAGEVYEACCVHTGHEWLEIFCAAFVFVFSLYWMTFGLEILGESAKVMTGCAAGSMFGADTNPLTAMMTGILATILMQSSGTTTGVVVALADASIIDAETGIYTVMGANIGTTVTATLVSFYHMGDKSKLERSFAAAVIHGMFNYFTIAVLFPLELTTGFLLKLTRTIAEGAETGREDSTYIGPVKRYVAPLSVRLLKSNKSLISKIASGEKTCHDFYPVACDTIGEESYQNCTAGLVGCDKSTGRCPIFFRQSATQVDDQLAGFTCFIISLVILMVSLMGIVWALNKLFFGMPTKVVHTLTICNGYIEFLVGVGLTMITQSSSITTSILTPFVGIGVVRLEQIYPVILGANLGTALNSTLGALSTIGGDALQIALAHLFFNLAGFLIWYPLPPLRQLPFSVSRRLGKNALRWNLFPVCYTVVCYMIFPLILLGVGKMYSSGSGVRAVAIILTVAMTIALLGLWLWCRFRGGREQYHSMLDTLGTQKLSCSCFDEEKDDDM